MAEVEILFTRARSKFAFFSTLIRIFISWRKGEKGLMARMSHCIFGWNWDSLPMKYEAKGAATRYLGQRYWDEIYSKSIIVTDVYTVQVSKECKKKIVKKCAEYASMPYAFMENVGILYVIIYEKIFGKTIKNPFGKADSKIKCSEWIAIIMEDMGLEHNLNLDNADPLQVFDVLFDLSIKKPDMISHVPMESYEHSY